MADQVIYNGSDITQYIDQDALRVEEGGKPIEVNISVALLPKGAALSFKPERTLEIRRGGVAKYSGRVTSVRRTFQGGNVPRRRLAVWQLTVADNTRLAKIKRTPTTPVLLRNETEKAWQRLQWFLITKGFRTLDGVEIISADLSQVSTGGISLVKDGYPILANGVSPWRFVVSVCMAAGLIPWLDAQKRLHVVTPNANRQSFEVSTDASVAPLDGGKPVVPVMAGFDLVEDSIDMVNVVPVVYGTDANRTFTYRHSASIAEYGQVWGDPLVLRDVTVYPLAFQLAKNSARNRVWPRRSGEITIPYNNTTKNVKAGYDLVAHDTFHRDDGSSRTVRVLTVQSYSLEYANGKQFEPTAIRLQINDEPWEWSGMPGFAPGSGSDLDVDPLKPLKLKKLKVPYYGENNPDWDAGKLVVWKPGIIKIDDGTVTPPGGGGGGPGGGGTAPDPDDEITKIGLEKDSGYELWLVPVKLVTGLQAVHTYGTIETGDFGATETVTEQKWEPWNPTDLDTATLMPETPKYLFQASFLLAQTLRNTTGGSRKRLFRIAHPFTGRVVRAGFFMPVKAKHLDSRATMVGFAEDIDHGYSHYSNAFNGRYSFDAAQAYEFGRPNDIVTDALRGPGVWTAPLPADGSWTRAAAALHGWVKRDDDWYQCGIWLGVAEAENELQEEQTGRTEGVAVQFSAAHPVGVPDEGIKVTSWPDTTPDLGYNINDPTHPAFFSGAFAFVLIDVGVTPSHDVFEEALVLDFEDGDTVVDTPTFTPGSETVWLNGQRLTRDANYTVVLDVAGLGTAIDLSLIRPKDEATGYGGLTKLGDQYNNEEVRFAYARPEGT